MQIVLEPTTGLHFPSPPTAWRLDQLSEAAAAELLRDGALILPWSLALLLQDHLDDEARAEELNTRRPEWLTPEDEDLLWTPLLEAALPGPTSLRLKLSLRGVPGRPGCALQTRWLNKRGRPGRPQPTVAGGVLDDGRERLTYGQHALLLAVAKSARLGAERNADFLTIDRVRAVVPPGDLGVVLDPYLQREQVVAAERIRPRLAVQADGSYRLEVHADGVPDAPLDQYLARAAPGLLGQIELSIPTADAGRQRVVFCGRGAPALQDARRFREEHPRLTPTQAARVLSNPSEHFGDNLDLSDCSERVLGLGPPVRRVVPILREIGARDWFQVQDPDALLEGVESAPDGEPEDAVSLKDPEVRRKLRDAIAAADERGETVIPDPFRPAGFLQVDQALRDVLERAEHRATESERKQQPKQERLVLQVEENLEDLAFDKASGPQPLVERIAARPPRLLPGFELFPHQLEGYSWLIALAAQADADESSWRGALLADDMGLGKTLQVLAFLDQLASLRGRQGPCLVVAPVALLENWQREARRFFGSAFEPTLQVLGASLPEGGAGAARLQAQRLVLVSYETLRRRELTFARVAWDVVVLDEAQKAKNPGSQVARVVRTLKARFRLAMTGTPVENTLGELWTVYDWAVPGLLGSLRSFAEQFIKPVAAASHEERLELASTLKRRVGPVFARRMKSEVQAGELPECIHHRHEVPLSAAQLDCYRELLAAMTDTEKPGVLPTLLGLFGVCAHPALHRAGRLPTTAEETFPKVQRLLDLLEDVARRGEKALLFANRVRIQHWLADVVAARFRVPVAVINGQVNESRRRMSILDEFSAIDGFAALVLAPRAAGVGLNITAANHVFHYMREWNPAVENQATDRAYRLGQERDVHVHTLIAVQPGMTTVEQRLDELLEEKRRLMRDFVVPMGGFDVEEGRLWGEC